MMWEEFGGPEDAVSTGLGDEVEMATVVVCGLTELSVRVGRFQY